VRALPRITAVIVLALSAVVLLGWSLNVRAMQSLYPGFVTMKANTAAGLAAASIALLCLDTHGMANRRARRITLALASLVAALGIGTLAQYLFTIDLGIDQMLFRAAADATLTRTPGRMAAVTALGFTLLGIGLAPIPWTRRWEAYAVQSAVVTVAAFGLMSLLGYVYGAIPTTGLGQGVQIAPHTAVAFVLLSVGLLASRADAGWMATVFADRAGGALARRMLPVAFVLPLALGALRQLGARLGFLQIASSSAALAVATMIAFGIIIWRTAAALNLADDTSRAAEQTRFQLALREAETRERLEGERRARELAERAREAAEQAVRDKDAAYAIIDKALSVAEEQREAAERAVREREDTLTVLDRVMESTTIGIAVFDRDLRFLHINSALAAINGRPAPAHLGRGVLEILPAHGADMAESLRRVLDTGVPIINAERVTESDGTPPRKRSWLMSFYPLRSSDGQPMGAGVTVLETTEQKHLEAQLRQAQKMEAVGQLAGGVAHDFNNILTVITSYSGILLHDLAADVPMRGDIEQIAAAADRAARLTRQLLAFSRQQVLEPRVVDLNELTAELEKLLRRLLPATIELETRLQPGLGLVLADPGQLEQVLMNLVVNARDAMPDGGQLTIETADMELDEESASLHVGMKAGAYVTVTVSDTGCGMDERVRAQIFDPFFTTKEKGQGTGLGLSTVYGIVRQSGGFIWVYSEPGHGSVFRVYLARSGSARVPRPRASGHAFLRPGSGRILLAEDESAVRAVSRLILERAGYTVLEATNGSAALQLAIAEAGIDLLITDMVMPELNGRELAERFRELHPRGAIAFMSGYTQEAMQRRSVFDDGVVFIQKPFTPQRLLEKVREALDGAESDDAGSSA
jgi:PAS domain S-box-containing protein